MYDLIEKKKRGGALSREEIEWMVAGFTDGEIPDYQMSAMLMAIYFKRMDDEEITRLTMAMAHSGDMVDLSPICGIKADKHSSGGVGDKTTLVACPIAAALGVKIAKMSGRGLGHTGGTIDKLESIPGFRTELDREEFFSLVNRTGIAIAGQSGNLVPADKKLYALRDVTATVDSIPLIASSIMSKKLASGSDGIVLDVKTGSGAFMKTFAGAKELAQKMVAIGRLAGKACVGLITDMDAPLGYAVGNALEVAEAAETLDGKGPEDLLRVSVELAANMLFITGGGDLKECRRRSLGAVEDKSALKALARMVEGQGGDPKYILEPDRFGKAAASRRVLSPASGFIGRMDAERIGIAGVCLGAGRSRKEDKVDALAGIILEKKCGDLVREGEVLATLYTSDEALLNAGAQELLRGYVITDEKPKSRPLILARVSAGGTEEYWKEGA